ncbi:hypothetical protein Vafri_1620 [Volvox africanus]|nr:hypothetical protein Vafri_1620 [Volvox africanus]
MLVYSSQIKAKSFIKRCWCWLLLTCIAIAPPPWHKPSNGIISLPIAAAAAADQERTQFITSGQPASAATSGTLRASDRFAARAPAPEISPAQQPRARISRQGWWRRQKAINDSKCPKNCTQYGTCNEELGRCDCPRDRDGLNCGHQLSGASLETRCKRQGYESLKECLNKDQSCINACNQRGVCVAGFCRCAPGFYGSDCSLSLGPGGKPVLLAGTGYRTREKRPWVYVYELPPHLVTWCNFRRLDRLLHVYIWQRLLGSGVRVADGDVANYYFIPVRQRSFGDSWVLREAVQYIQQHHPWWNRTGGGHRHVVIHTGDWGLGEVAEDVRLMTWNVTWLTHWGLSVHRPEVQRWNLAFRPERDVVIPVYISPGHYVRFGVIRSPLHPSTAARAKPRNVSTLFFAGRICHDPRLPSPKTFPACGDDTAEWYGGGVREKFFVAHWNRSGFHVVRSEPRYGFYMSRSAFCLAPPGAGHGQRQIQALFMGCAPVIVADGVAEPFEPALNWGDWGVRLAEEAIPQAHELLAAGLSELPKKQARMHCAAQHMLYSTITGAVLGEDGRYDAFETTLEVLRVRAAHPDAPQEDFRHLDPDFAAFMDCRRPPGFKWLNGTVTKRIRDSHSFGGKGPDEGAEAEGIGGSSGAGTSWTQTEFASTAMGGDGQGLEVMYVFDSKSEAAALWTEESQEHLDASSNDVDAGPTDWGRKGEAAAQQHNSEVSAAGSSSTGSSSLSSPSLDNPQFAGLCSHAARDMRHRERGCYYFLRGGGYLGVPGGAMCAKGFKTRLAACPRLWG